MAIAVTTSKQTMANSYAAAATWVGVATGNPGSTTTPANEATGGSPAYARQQTTWTAGSGGIQNGSAVTINAAAATYTFALLASAATTGAANMWDNVAVTSTTLGGQGTLVVTPSYTQT